MSWIRVVITELGRADSQPADWYGWATNQCGHVLVGILLTWAGIMAGLAMWLAGGAVLALYLLKEVGDVRRGGKLGDGLTDMGFVAAGIAAAVSMATGSGMGFGLAFCAIIALAAYGIRQRIKRSVGAAQ